MIPLISGICVEEKGWITSDEMMDVTVVAESTPGPMAINCATYVGWKLGGMAGAVAGTLGIVTPAFVIIYLISLFFGAVHRHLCWLRAADAGGDAAVDPPFHHHTAAGGSGGEPWGLRGPGHYGG